MLGSARFLLPEPIYHDEITRNITISTAEYDACATHK